MERQEQMGWSKGEKGEDEAGSEDDLDVFCCFFGLIMWS